MSLLMFRAVLISISSSLTTLIPKVRALQRYILARGIHALLRSTRRHRRRVPPNITTTGMTKQEHNPLAHPLNKVHWVRRIHHRTNRAHVPSWRVLLDTVLATMHAEEGRDPDREVVGSDTAVVSADAFGDKNAIHKCLYRVGEDGQFERDQLEKMVVTENSLQVAVVLQQGHHGD
jgi:hypothetical protein